MTRISNSLGTLARFAACLVACVSTNLAFATPPSNRDWVFRADLSDDFSGTHLDNRKWNADNPYYKGNRPGLYVKENIEVSGGRLKLWIRHEDRPDAPAGYHTYTLASLSTQPVYGHGYYEARAQLPDSQAVCAFWLYRWTPVGTYEIDIYEIAAGARGHQQVIHTNTHRYQGDPVLENEHNRTSTPYGWNAPSRLANVFHTYGLDWNKKEIVWYFNGQPVRRRPVEDFSVPMTVRFSCETHAKWTGLPDPANLPAIYEIDYFKFWQPQ